MISRIIQTEHDIKNYPDRGIILYIMRKLNLIELFYYTFKIVIVKCKQSVAVKRLLRLILQNFVIFACFEVVASNNSQYSTEMRTSQPPDFEN